MSSVVEKVAAEHGWMFEGHGWRCRCGFVPTSHHSFDRHIIEVTEQAVRALIFGEPSTPDYLRTATVTYESLPLAGRIDDPLIPLPPMLKRPSASVPRYVPRHAKAAS